MFTEFVGGSPYLSMGANPNNTTAQPNTNIRWKPITTNTNANTTEQSNAANHTTNTTSPVVAPKAPEKTAAQEALDNVKQILINVAENIGSEGFDLAEFN